MQGKLYNIHICTIITRMLQHAGKLYNVHVHCTTYILPCTGNILRNLNLAKENLIKTLLKKEWVLLWAK